MNVEPSYQRTNFEMHERRHAPNAQMKEHHLNAETTQQRFKYLNENLHNLSDVARIPLQISLTQQIQHLREEMNSLRVDSDSFKDKMECILVTLENLNEASFAKNSPWVAQGMENPSVFEENPKNPISFKSPDRRKWVTGIASRISRDNTDPKANKPLLSPSEIRVKPAPELHHAVTEVPVIVTDIHTETTRPLPNEINMRSKRNDCETDAVTKPHSKITETRPTSDSFVSSHVKGRPNDTIEREITIQPKCANRLLSQGNEDFSNPSPKSANGEEQVRMLPVLDRTSKTLLTSEDSIDSGYHGGIPSSRTDQYEMAEFRLSSVEETHVIENKEQTAQNAARPSSLSLMKNTNAAPPTSDKSEEKVGLAWEGKSEMEDHTKPKAMPRNTKKIKMGVSAVMGPHPRNKGFDSSSQEDGAVNNAHKEEKQERDEEKKLEYFRRSHHPARAKQEMKKMQKMKMKNNQVSGSDSEMEGSSALRRRSMRMMSEFRMFDFSDSVKGINSSPKTTPNTQMKKKQESDSVKKQTIAKVVEEKQPSSHSAAKPPSHTGETSKKPPIRSNNSNSKSKKKSEQKFGKEPLPPPPLPPPPSPPHEKHYPVQKEAPFVGFTSLATHSKEALICHGATEMSLPSPRCVRRPVHGSTKSLQSTGAVSYGSISPHNSKVTNITPSEGSAFTPVGYSNRCSHEVLPCPGEIQTSRESFMIVGKENAPVPFKRRSSLPPSAISHRNQHKKSQANKPPPQYNHAQAPPPSNSSHLNYEANPVNVDSNFKRSVSMRLPKTRHLYADQNNMENNPVVFNKEDNITSVVGKLKQAGYLSNGKKHSGRSSLGANTTQQHMTPPVNGSQVIRRQDYHSGKKYEFVEQRSPRIERKMEAERLVKSIIYRSSRVITRIRPRHPCCLVVLL